jgi:hypothetical protein
MFNDDYSVMIELEVPAFAGMTTFFMLVGRKKGLLQAALSSSPSPRRVCHPGESRDLLYSF